MTTLLIKDIATATELDSADMASITGGTCYYKAPASYCPPVYGVPAEPKGHPSSFSFDASQMIGQSQNVQNNNGNNAAFVCDITSTVNPTQTGKNNISF